MLGFVLHAWPILASVLGFGGVIALLVMSPGGPAVGLKFWREILIAILAVAAFAFFKLSEDRAGEIVAANTRADAAEKSAKDWRDHSDKVEALAAATETARASERTRLINLANTAATAKQGIFNAPGASDSFAYSDAAFGFMRHPTGEPAPAAGKASADVERR